MELKTIVFLVVVLGVIGFIYFKGDSIKNPFAESKGTQGVIPNQSSQTYFQPPPPVVVQDKRDTRYGIEPGNSQFLTMSLQPSLYNRIGAKMVKLEANSNGAQWSSIQPSRNDWRFENLDYFINQWQKEGYEVVVVIRSNAGWAVKPVYRRDTFTRYGDKASTPPYSIAEYSAFLSKIFERYDMDGTDDMPGLISPVKYYQIEEEVSTERDFQGTVQEYNEMLSTAYGLKQGNTTIISGGINFFTMLDNTTEMQPYQIITKLHNYTDSERALNFTRSILLNGKFDAVRVNNYGDASSIPNIKTHIESELLLYNNRGKEIWVTDYSMPFAEHDLPIPYDSEYSMNSTASYTLMNKDNAGYNSTYDWYIEEWGKNLNDKIGVYEKSGFDRISVCCTEDLLGLNITLG